MQPFTAYRVHRDDHVIRSRLESITLEDLDPGDVVIRAAWSDVNYKDALAATGAGKIMRRFPMVAGIDVSGQVHSSDSAQFATGDPVLVIGSGLGEERDGGYAEYVRVPADRVLPLPAGLSLYEAMAFGTAGFTAALAVQRMEDNGQHPEHGPILVNGATGGVGSFAIAMLSSLGFEVTALTGKPQSSAYLRGLGATEILLRRDVEMGDRPLEKTLWGGAVDSVGGNELGWLTRTVRPLGNIASIGLAGGHTLSTTVMPFILRGINLLGINSVLIPRALKLKILQRLAGDLKPENLALIVSREVTLEQLDGIFQDYLDGSVTGRTVVKIS